MSVGLGMATDFNAAIRAYGSPCRFRYFSRSFGGSGSGVGAGSYYDEAVLAQSGSDVWTSGVWFMLNGAKGSDEAVLLEQGLIKSNDLRLYCSGGLVASGAYRVGLGSPIENEYQVIDTGVDSPQLQGVDVYKKLFLRLLPTGSLSGE